MPIALTFQGKHFCHRVSSLAWHPLMLQDKLPSAFELLALLEEGTSQGGYWHLDYDRKICYTENLHPLQALVYFLEDLCLEPESLERERLVEEGLTVWENYKSLRRAGWTFFHKVTCCPREYGCSSSEVGLRELRRVQKSSPSYQLELVSYARSPYLFWRSLKIEGYLIGIGDHVFDYKGRTLQTTPASLTACWFSWLLGEATPEVLVRELLALEAGLVPCIS